MKKAVVYKSKYGATRQYAEWIAKELNCPVFEQSKITPEELKSCEVVVYGGGLYAGMINGIKWAKKYDNKKLIIFAVGLTTPETINLETLSKPLPLHAKLFYFRGKQDSGELSLPHKLGMKILKSMLSKKSPEKLSAEEKGILEALNGDADFIDKSAIQPLIEYVRSETHE